MASQPHWKWPENLMRRLEPQPNGCIYYTGYGLPSGYGTVSLKGQSEYAHRAMYRLMIGPIPQGMEINHACHSADTSCPGGSGCPHRRCVNPGHLEVVTHRENILRSRTPMAINAAKTHCVHGHPFDEANTFVTKAGSRGCRKCRRIRDRARKRAYKARPRKPRYINGVTPPVD